MTRRSSRPKVSILVATRTITQFLREALPHYKQLRERNFELLILPDKKKSFTSRDRRIKVLPTGTSSPAKKRDLGAKKARAPILALLDDDAYPQRDWLDRGLRHFTIKEVSAVGGPAITPPKSTFWQKVSGASFESILGGGGARNRYIPIGVARSVDDWPSVNFIVRKRDYFSVGGFDTNFWPGEDTKFCLDLVAAGKKIHYDPTLLVYHHRRRTPIGHLQQVAQYGLHRGFFVKKYPKTSRRLHYFVPTFFIVFLLVLFVLSIRLLFNTEFPNKEVIHFSWQGIPSKQELRSFGLWGYLWLLFVVIGGIYGFGLILDGVLAGARYKNALVGLASMPMIFLTHLVYGWKFLVGFLRPKLRE